MFLKLRGLWGAALLLVSLLATGTLCRGADDRIAVVATLPMIGEWVQAVGGDAVALRVLAPGGSDPHAFEPTPRGVAAARDAHLVFGMGLGLEPWLERIARANPALNVVWIAPHDNLRRIGPAAVAEPDHSHAHTHAHAGCEHSHGDWDPHVWLDPQMAVQMVRTIVDNLSAVAPAQAAQFARNAEAYINELTALDAELTAQFAQIPVAGRKLVTNHDNMHYFARRYGFTVADTLFTVQGSEGGTPSARKVRALVGRIREAQIRVLFADAFSGQELLEAVAREAQLPAPVMLYSIPGGAGGPAADYFRMMRYNGAAIVRALTPSDSAEALTAVKAD